MSIIFLTGAGISISSGISPFRGEGGMYNGLGDKSENIISKDGLVSNPELFWISLSKIYNNEYSPNCNHAMISNIGNRFNKHLIVTQNIDNLHNKYKNDDNIIELHGNNKKLICVDCGVSNIQEFKDIPDKCDCGGQLRPDIILFGENINNHK